MMRRGVWLCAALLIGCGPAEPPAPPSEATLEVFPAWTRAAPGVVRDVEVWRRGADGSVQDVTAQVTLEGEGVAEVVGGDGPPGVRVRGVGAGRLIARLGTLESAVRVEGLDVQVEGLRIRPREAVMSPGESQRLQAFGRFGGGPELELTRAVRWQLVDAPAGVMTLTEGTGRVVVSGKAAGEGGVVAAFGEARAQAQLTVSEAALDGLVMERSSLTLPVGTSLPIDVQGRFVGEAPRSMGARAVWSAQDERVARVSAEGVVSALGVGRTVIEARSGAQQARLEVNVVALKAREIAITPGDGVMALGEEGQFSASALFEDGSAVYVTREGVWSSSDPGVLAVGNGPRLGGQVTALAVGQAVLRVEFAGATGELVVQVRPAP
jgi:hypothetical protein